MSAPANHVAGWAIVIGASFVAAVVDSYQWKIPNLLSLPMFMAGLICSAISNGTAGVAESLLGWCLMAAPFIVLFVIAGGGAGDAKFMGAVGAWLGPRSGLIALLCVLASGMVLGAAFSLHRRRAGQVVQNLLGLGTMVIAVVSGRRTVPEALALGPANDQQVKMPYGLAILAGVCLAAAGELLWRR